MSGLAFRKLTLPRRMTCPGDRRAAGCASGTFITAKSVAAGRREGSPFTRSETRARPVARASRVVFWTAARPPPHNEPHMSEGIQGSKDAAAAETVDIGRPVAPPRPSHGDPEQVGPYRVIERIGEGGMGLVYKAEQRQPVRRIVALKVIRSGMATE